MRTFQAPSLNLKSHFVIDLESTGEIRKDCPQYHAQKAQVFIFSWQALDRIADF